MTYEQTRSFRRDSGLTWNNDLMQQEASRALHRAFYTALVAAVAIVVSGAVVIAPYYPTESEMAYLDGGR
jgi:predicted membrane-bound mannosyltransferase